MDDNFGTGASNPSEKESYADHLYNVNHALREDLAQRDATIAEMRELLDESFVLIEGLESWIYLEKFEESNRVTKILQKLRAYLKESA